MAAYFDLVSFEFSHTFPTQYGKLKAFKLQVRDERGEIHEATQNRKPRDDDTYYEVGQKLHGYLEETEHGKKFVNVKPPDSPAQAQAQHKSPGGPVNPVKDWKGSLADGSSNPDKFERRPEHPKNVQGLRHGNAISNAPHYYKLAVDLGVAERPPNAEVFRQVCERWIEWLKGLPE